MYNQPCKSRCMRGDKNRILVEMLEFRARKQRGHFLAATHTSHRAAQPGVNGRACAIIDVDEDAVRLNEAEICFITLKQENKMRNQS